MKNKALWQVEGGSGQGPGESGLLDAFFIFHSPALPCDMRVRKKRKLGQRIRAQGGLRFNRILLGFKLRLSEIV